jgi:hypothetical protein
MTDTLCENPLDTCGGMITQAVMNVYRDQCAKNRPPSLEEMNIHFPAHFFQLLYLHIVVNEAYESVDAKDEQHFREALASGKYDPFMPDATTLHSYLNLSQLSFFNQDYLLLNNAVIGVW